MDWNEANERERQTLQRIIALLVSLAVICERAALLPRPVRAFLLWLLRPAEAAVRVRVIGDDYDIATHLDDLILFEAADSPDHARQLALRFRLLAQLLEDDLHAVTWVPGSDLEQDVRTAFPPVRNPVVPVEPVRRDVRKLLAALRGALAGRIPDTATPTV